MKLRFLPEARWELDSAAAWYENHSLSASARLLDEYERVQQKIKRNPQAHVRAEFYTGPREVRRCQLKKFPYIVIYECRGVNPISELIVVAVSHTSREPLYWVERLSSI
ncbi:MAG: type II toxin-antitoxin system RelE/ParE family toxin [Pirellulales bacterium]|nr:type II toxin-antitoxin system RelE/ParE family toxin [Pirellulales bacterium]